jgi:hypothetical protein
MRCDDNSYGKEQDQQQENAAKRPPGKQLPQAGYCQTKQGMNDSGPIPLLFTAPLQRYNIKRVQKRRLDLFKKTGGAVIETRCLPIA